MQLKGKVAIITGASRGIGKGIATVFAREGASVVVVARTEQAGGKLPGTIYETAEQIQAQGGTALALRCDVTSEEEVAAMVQATLEKFGHIDILVNNAGGSFTYGKVAEYPADRFDKVMALNIRGTFLCCKAVLPAMTKQGRGVIINITSGSGQHFSVPGDTVYGMSKAAVDRFTIGFANEVRKLGISVVGVQPGMVRTEGIDLVLKGKEMDWSKWQRPEEVGPPLVWLAQQRPETFTARIVRSTDFGTVWP
jgi:NAD(P)-dependent dehydrogenase (short-subunit alcohol dehydrogenase family)